MREIRQIGKTDMRSVSARSAVDTGTESIVQEQFKDEVDVNVIVRRFGGLPPVNEDGGVYGDFTGISSFEDAAERIQRARADFMRLDPKVRERYDNDPGRFLAAASAMSQFELDEFSKAAAPVAPVPAPAPAPEAPPAPPAES